MDIAQSRGGPDASPAFLLLACLLRSASVSTKEGSHGLVWDLARLLRTRFFREARVKSCDGIPIRNLAMAQRQLMRTEADLANGSRGILCTFGLVLRPGSGGKRHFEADAPQRAEDRGVYW